MFLFYVCFAPFFYPQIVLQPTKTCVSCKFMRAWFAVSQEMVWWLHTQSAAVTTAVAGGPSVTPVHPEAQVSKLKMPPGLTDDYYSLFPLNSNILFPLCSEMFSRLCEMHLETESDGEQDFLAAFIYNPGKTIDHFIQ